MTELTQGAGGPEVIGVLLSLPADVFNRTAAEAVKAFVASAASEGGTALKLVPVERFMAEVVAEVSHCHRKLNAMQFIGKAVCKCPSDNN